MSSPEDPSKRYVAAIRALLLSEWDPIGVGDIPEAQDEYDSYARDLARLVAERRPAPELFEYLRRVETRTMELPGNRQRSEQVAQMLARLADEIDARG